MSVSLMRVIDRYLGVLLCWLVGIMKSIVRPAFPPPLPHNPERILCVKFFGMGSLILTTPAIALLRSSYPSVRIEFLTFESNRELLERYPMIDEIHAIRTTTPGRFLVDTLSILRKLRSKRYDVVFDFEFFSKYSTLLGSLVRTNIRVGFSLPTRWRAFHLTHQVRLNKDEHVTKAFLRQVFVLCGEQGQPNTVTPPLLGSGASDSLESKLPLNGRPIIAVNVNAGETFIERRWPLSYFAKLVASLAAELPHDFYFVGSAREREYMDTVIESTGVRQRCSNVGGILTLAELGVLFRRCELLISNDSMPVHLAASVGLPCIALYGPESPTFYGSTDRAAIAITRAIPCSPCMNVYAAKSFRCPYDAACMKAISPDEVKLVVEGILQRA